VVTTSQQFEISGQRIDTRNADIIMGFLLTSAMLQVLNLDYKLIDKTDIIKIVDY
jgi:hypothetical protein